MSVSVVITTYNGEKYIVDQLESLRNQTRKIDEVLIYDDGSTDSTSMIVENFIKDFKLENWHFIVNKKNKGWKRNFHDGVKETSSDFIFPCDQDDIWHNDKIEKMEKVMLENPDINVLVGRYHKFFDDESTNKCKKKKTIWESTASFIDKVSDKENKQLDGSINKVPFNAKFLQLMPGCCFCIRKSFFNRIEQYWFPELGHDAFYTFFSKLTDSFAIYNCYVIDWRQHIGSTSRPEGRQKSTRIKEIDRNTKVVSILKRYIEKNEIDSYIHKMSILDNAEKWCKIRQKFICSKNIIYGIKLLKYYKYYERGRAIFTDWLYAFMEE